MAKKTLSGDQQTAEKVAKNLTERYGRKVIVGSFGGYPVVIFEDRVFDEDGYNKGISNYP